MWLFHAAQGGDTSERKVAVIPDVLVEHVDGVATLLELVPPVVDERLQHVAACVAVVLVALGDDEGLVHQARTSSATSSPEMFSSAHTMRAAARLQLPR